MKTLAKILAASALCVPIPLASAADTGITSLQFEYVFGADSAQRISLSLYSFDRDISPHSRSIVELPLYSSNKAEAALLQIDKTKQSEPLCKRNTKACMAMGVAMGIGIMLLVRNAAEDDDDRNVKVTVTSGSTTGSKPDSQFTSNSAFGQNF
ncbi:MAG: hypothetical protein OEU36_04990 [Gammaproteobacteria bacterium]|nr:hypothetical protein [Gammaproteobacteria bacterium]